MDLPAALPPVSQVKGRHSRAPPSIWVPITPSITMLSMSRDQAQVSRISRIAVPGLAVSFTARAGLGIAG